MKFSLTLPRAVDNIIKNINTWFRWVQVIVAVLVGCSILYTVIRYWDQLIHYDRPINWYFILAALGIITISIYWWAFVWSHLLNHLNRSAISLKDSINLYIQSNITKYIPGFIWNYVSRSVIGKKIGYGQQSIWIANIYDYGVGILTGSVLYLVSLFLPHFHTQLFPIEAVSIFIIFCLILLSPMAINFIYRLVRHTKRSTHLINLRQLIVYFLSSLLTWLMVGSGFWLLIKGLALQIQTSYIPEAIGTWSITVVVSMLMIFFPQGWGIKEALLVFFLSFLVPIPQAITIALASRFWVMAGDILSYASWWFIYRLIKPVQATSISTNP